MTDKTEEFKPIPFAPGYFVSDQGRVRKGHDKILFTPINKKGYVVFVATLNGKRISKMLHRVVAEVFIGPVDGLEVDHLDMDKTNNRVENLEIVTRQENMRRFNASSKSLERNLKISDSKKKYWATKERPAPKPKTDIETRGGRRENQTGRPRLPTEQKRVKVAITMTREHYEATRDGRSAIVEQALGLLLGENLNTQQTKQMEKQFVFGWVASNVNGNFENWSSWKDYGTREDAEKFYKETEKAAEEKGGLDWFCIEIEE